MRIRKKTLKRVVIALLVVITVTVVIMYAKTPKYPDIDTPKPYLGNKDASVQIVEFSDLECPACKRAHPVVKSIIEEYGDRIGFQFYHLPLPSLHPHAFKAAEAVECVNDQGKYYEFIDAIYSYPNEPTKNVLKTIAEAVNLDIKSFNACLDSGAKKWVVDADLSEANYRGLYATPTIFVNDVQLESWQYESFKKAVEDALEDETE